MINDVFHTFIERLTPTENEIQKAKARSDHLKKIVQKLNLGVFEIQNSGSFAKKTAVKPLKDIDVVFFIDDSQYPYDNPDRVLHRIARAIRGSYPQNEVKVGNRSVNLMYADEFYIDIVPALCKKREIEGAKIIDREKKTWIATSIPKHIEFVNRMQNIDSRYRNLVMIFKEWKNQRKRTFPSFLLSLLVAYVLNTQKLSDNMENAITNIFKFISRTRLEEKLYFTQFYDIPTSFPNDPVVVLDPSNPNNNVASFMDQKAKNEFLNAWNQNYRLALKALESPYKYEKISKWKVIFGDRFPSR